MTLVPHQRIGEPIDIARAAVWLASDDSDYVVGATLFVYGGMTLYSGFATGADDAGERSGGHRVPPAPSRSVLKARKETVSA